MFLPSKLGQTLVLVAPDTRVSELVCYYTLIETLTWIMCTTLNEQMSAAKYYYWKFAQQQAIVSARVGVVGCGGAEDC